MNNKTISTLAGICLGMISVLATPLVYADGALPEPPPQGSFVSRTPVIVGTATAELGGMGVSTFTFNGMCKGETFAFSGSVDVAFGDLTEANLEDVYFSAGQANIEPGNCNLGGEDPCAAGVIITSVGHVADVDETMKIGRGVVAHFVYFPSAACPASNADYAVPEEEIPG